MTRHQQQKQALTPWSRQEQQRSPYLQTHSLFPSLWEGEGAFDFPLDQSGLSVYEDKKNMYVEASLPGLKQDEIDVSLDKGILFIHGEKKEAEEDKEKRFYRRASSSFSYRVALPNHIDESKDIKATYKDGLMKITLPKSHERQGKKIAVKNA